MVVQQFKLENIRVELKSEENEGQKAYRREKIY